MNTKIKPVTFRNQNGKKLFGMLHTPDNPIPDYGIIIVSPGIKSRVAPHRLYLKMAKRFEEVGFPVLRVDPEGLGDSEGEIDEKWTADVYCSMELGRLIEDTIASMNWMERECDITKFILSGLCGGAITALLTAERDQRVVSILSLGMTCTLASSNIDPLQYITEGQLFSIRDKYLKKLFNYEAWKRFLSFKSDYRLLLKSLVQPLIKRISKQNSQVIPTQLTNDASDIPDDSNLNPHFVKAFTTFIANKKILLIFSESDRLYWEFEEKFMRHYGSMIEPFRSNFEVYIVSEANHTFSFSKWKEEMLEKSCKWLQL